jgi:hypothetical protein
LPKQLLRRWRRTHHDKDFVGLRVNVKQTSIRIAGFFVGKEKQIGAFLGSTVYETCGIRKPLRNLC